MHSALPPFLLVFDMDGVLYRGSEPIADAAVSIQTLRSESFQIAFLTNNAWSIADDYSARLAEFGIHSSPEEFMSSSMATAEVVAGRHPGATVYVQGGPGLRHYLQEAGLSVVTPEDEEVPVDVVVAGIDWDFTYAKLARAQHALLNGAQFYATNVDPRYPVEGGRMKPGAGSLIAAISAASGVEPIVIGKPASIAIELLMARFGRRPKQTLMIGDQLATDIVAGNRAGCRTALITTGVSSAADAELAQGTSRPTYVYDSLAALTAALVTDDLLTVRR